MTANDYAQLRKKAAAALKAFRASSHHGEPYANFTNDELIKLLQDQRHMPVALGDSQPSYVRRAPRGSTIVVCVKLNSGHSVRIFHRGTKFWHGYVA